MYYLEHTLTELGLLDKVSTKPHEYELPRISREFWSESSYESWYEGKHNTDERREDYI